jgi:hypothetical protein
VLLCPLLDFTPVEDVDQTLANHEQRGWEVWVPSEPVADCRSPNSESFGDVTDSNRLERAIDADYSKRWKSLVLLASHLPSGSGHE